MWWWVVGGSRYGGGARLPYMLMFTVILADLDHLSYYRQCPEAAARSLRLRERMLLVSHAKSITLPIGRLFGFTTIVYMPGRVPHRRRALSMTAELVREMGVDDVDENVIVRA